MCNGSRKCDLSSEHARRIYWYGGKVSRNEDFSSRSIDSGRWISGICSWIGARKSAERSLFARGESGLSNFHLLPGQATSSSPRVLLEASMVYCALFLRGNTVIVIISS